MICPTHTNLIRRPRRGGGFSLVELIVMIVITIVLAAAAAPAISSFSTTRASAAAKLLLRDITFARQYAVATGTPVWVVFNSGAGTWSILVESTSNPGRANATAYTDPATGVAYVQSLSGVTFGGVTITAVAFDANISLGFNWLGQPLNHSETALAAEGSVTLTGNYKVIVEPGTGHARYVAP